MRCRPAAVDTIAVRSHSDDNVITMSDGDYGFDAPYALIIFAAVGAATGVAASRRCGIKGGRLVAIIQRVLFGNALGFLCTTRRGKFKVWNDVLDELHLRDDERVLDMGCGRGAV
jgi:protein-L-isoaspartate O-methyltransferase